MNIFEVLGSDELVAVLWLFLSGTYAFQAMNRIKIIVVTLNTTMEDIEKLNPVTKSIRQTTVMIMVHKLFHDAIAGWFANVVMSMSILAPPMIALNGILIMPDHMDISLRAIYWLLLFCIVYFITSGMRCNFRLKVIDTYYKSNLQKANEFALLNRRKLLPRRFMWLDLIARVVLFMAALQLFMHMFL